MRLSKAYQKNSIPQLYLMREACKKLLGYYTGIGSLDGCVICDALSESSVGNYATTLCDGITRKNDWILCPWKAMEGKTCGEYAAEKGYNRGPGSLRIVREPNWCKLRIPQLKRWIKRLTLYIKTRERIK